MHPKFVTYNETVLFLENERMTQQQSGKQPIRFGDIYQSASRTPTSTADEIPTCLPSSKLFDSQEKCLLLGRELMHMQGLFSGPVYQAVLLSTILQLHFPTDSELEEERGLLQLASNLQKHRKS